MIIKNIAKNRTFTNVVLNADYVVAGGGLTGVCSAIAAAREGLRVVLIQDRPVLGGNASSEVRLWALGATSHMGNNNRWSREGGIIDEILVENVYRNKEGNPVLFDMVLMDKVLTEKNITLLLNTTLYKVDKSNIFCHSYKFAERDRILYFRTDVCRLYRRWYVRLSCRSIIQNGGGRQNCVW